jgi:DNA-binding ferritin-like protein (Dps family)
VKKTRVQSEALRYLENARELLNKSPIEGDRYEDMKYVQEACGTAYLAVLKSIDSYLLKRGVYQKDLPQSVEGYRDMIRKYLIPYNGKLTKEFEKLYKELHMAGYYRGLIEDVNALKNIFRSARSFIEKTKV